MAWNPGVLGPICIARCDPISPGAMDKSDGAGTLPGERTMQSDYAVRLDHVSRHFGDVRAVDDVTLDIADGEFFTMLGPSGSGKTTCLRLIAGFDQPTAGRIFLHGQDVSNKPPY